MPQIKITGPDLTEARVRELGQIYAELLNTVAEEMHGRSLGVRCTGARRLCDGCDRLADTFDRPPGWVTMPDGRDYCDACVGEAT